MPDILYNLQSIRSPLTGIGRYACELMQGMLESELDVTAVHLGRKHLKPSLVKLIDSLEHGNEKHRSHTRQLITRLPYAHSLYRQFANYRFSKTLENELRNGGLYHDLNYTPCESAKRTLATVYDLSHLSQAATHPSHRVKYLNHYFNRLAKNHDPILTISNAIKEELCAAYKIQTKRIFVTPLAASEHFKPRTENECLKILSKYQLTYKRFVLCVGAIEPRKNLIRTLNAYSGLAKDLRSEFPLVVVGPKGWKDVDIQQRIAQLETSGCVYQLGFVPQRDLPFIYSAAAVLVYPSLYEGFGLPVLEAMASGCPTISSNQGALAELTQSCSLSVNPTKQYEIQEQLHDLLNNASLRTNLSEKGRQRSLDFSWSKTIDATEQIYRSF